MVDKRKPKRSLNARIELERFIKKHLPEHNFSEIANLWNVAHSDTLTQENIRNFWRYNNNGGTMAKKKTPAKGVKGAIADLHKQEAARIEKKQRTDALKMVQALEEQVNAIKKLARPAPTHIIKPHVGGRGGEATAIVVASDWHIEETVSPDSVNGSNGYTFEIAKQRADEFFKMALHLRNLEAKNSPVPNMVIALLGDFITGNLHQWHGTPSNCSMQPVEAAYEAHGLIQSGIDFLLKESDLNLTLVCHAGNHARITAKSPDSETEMGNSLEFFIYGFLAKHYADNPRVKVIISKSYASRLQIYGTVLRFHHGHRVKYGGGIGGLAVPASKFTLRKNTHWQADYDVFGHHHQKQLGPRFICNGSMIGYNAYASDGAFEYERPSQTYFLINRRWKEIIDYRPILFSV